MKDDRLAPAYVTAICVLLTLLFYRFLDSVVLPSLSGVDQLAFFVGWLASLGFYMSTFSFLKWLYFRLVHNKLEPQEDIVGEWFYVLTINDRPTSTKRYGICKVSRKGKGFFLAGVHYNPDKAKFTSRFASDLVHLDSSEIIIMYSSFGVDQEAFSRKGVYFLEAEGSPPRRMLGIWTDVLGSRNHGDIVMQRRDSETDALLKRLGYPSETSELEQLVNAPTEAPRVTPADARGEVA